jgi:hypothetical protein
MTRALKGSKGGVLKARHPGVRAILLKLENGVPITPEEVKVLARQLATTGATHCGVGQNVSDGAKVARDIGDIEGPDLLSGFATESGSKLFSDNFGKGTCSFYNVAERIRISNIGLGTHRGRQRDRSKLS